MQRDRLPLRVKIPTAAIALLVIVIAVVLGSFKEELTKVPRVRVGPLVTQEPAEGRLRFFAVGDTGTGNDDQMAVAAAMEARCAALGGIDGLLLLGDNAYQVGFASVEDPQWQTKVLTPYGGDCVGKAPIYPVLGNHDYKGNPAAQIEFSLINARWRMPNRFYAVRFGDLLELIAFDSQISEFCFKPAFCSVDFLLDQIRGAATVKGEPDFAWTVVMAHHPLESASGHGHGHGGGLRSWLLQPFLCDRIDAWIAGHAHHMEHRTPDCRMQLFVSGGGGANLYPVDPDEAKAADVRFAEARHGFLELEVDRQAMRTRFVGTDGGVLHEGERRKAP